MRKPNITKRTQEISQTLPQHSHQSPLIIYVAALQAREVTSSFYNDNNEDNQVPILQLLDSESPFSCLSVLHTEGTHVNFHGKATHSRQSQGLVNHRTDRHKGERC